MLYDIAHFWFALLVAVALGALVGWYTLSDEPRRGPIFRLGYGWIFWSGVLFFVGLVLALVHVVPDRPGLWLETALLIFVAYLVGCPLPGLLFATRVEQAPGSVKPPDVLPPRPLPAAGVAARSGSIADAADRLGDGRSPPTPVALPPVTPSPDAYRANVSSTTHQVDGAATVGRPTEAAGFPLKPTSDAAPPSRGIISDDPASVDKPKR